MNREMRTQSLNSPGGGPLREGLRHGRPSLFEMAEIGDREINFAAPFYIIWRRKWYVIAAAAAAVCFAVWNLNGVTPLYSATTTVVLEARKDQIREISRSHLLFNYFSINTEVRIMESHRLVGRLVDDMNLIEDPDFNTRLRPQTSWKNSEWGKAVVTLLGLSAAPRERPVPPPEIQRRRVINDIIRRINAKHVKESYVYEISIETPDPQKSADIANRLAELYVLEQSEAKLDSIHVAAEWLSGRVGDLKIAVEEAEAKVEKFLASTQLISEAELAAESAKLKELRDRKAEYAAEIENLQITLDRVAEAENANDLERIVELLDSPRITRAYAQVNGARRDDRQAQPRRKPAMAAFWNETENRITQIRRHRNRIEDQIQALDETVTKFEARIDRQGGDIVILRQLTREAEANRLIYQNFLNRMNEITVQEGNQFSDSRILDRATPSSGASHPNWGETLTSALLIGLLIGSILVVLWEKYRVVFRTAEDLEKATGLRVMGSIPLARISTRKGMLNHIINKPASGLAEAVRNLRTSLLLSNAEKPPKVIVSTSSVPKEGKTTLAVLLAQNLAALGNRVLLIECDLRRRMLDAYFDGSLRQWGLISVLYGDAAFEDAVTHDELTGVDVLLGEESPMSAADVFASRQFGEFIGEMRERYDSIVIDTPPILAVPDARLIAALGDAVIYSVGWDRTSRDLIHAGLDQLREIDRPRIGMVLNQINMKKASKYRDGGYYRYYKLGSGYYKN